jgi:outer membrane protein assembly factor BamE (lipoprotein component of BamABCDE complex)
MNKAELRQLLGRPAQTKVYELKQEEVWDWRFRQEPEDKQFSVTFDMSGAVKSTQVDLDPRSKYTGGK